jgi:hypothetical protein
MRPDAALVLWIGALVAFGAPLLLGLAGLIGRGPAASGSKPRWDLRLSAVSCLCYVLAFNLVFVVQELFLVLPKAMTPGLHPVLFHNNHNWSGHHPLEKLFQGTGALVILLLGLGALAWVKRRPPRDITLRLFVTWLAFQGVFQSLPQVVVGAALPENDVGMAMDYLRLSRGAMIHAAVWALAAMAIFGAILSRRFLELATNPAEIEARGRRTAFVFQIATLPALAGAALLVPFRVPGSLDQVAIWPALVAVIGIAWVQAWAWRTPDVQPAPVTGAPSIRVPLAALIAVLAVFQLVLRPGIAF